MNRYVVPILAAVVVLTAGGRASLGEGGRLTFRVKVSGLGLQASSRFAEGKQPEDVVEVTLPGQWYDPPRPVPVR